MQDMTQWFCYCKIVMRFLAVSTRATTEDTRSKASGSSCIRRTEEKSSSYRVIMSAMAIAALRVDLTSLLISARSACSPDRALDDSSDNSALQTSLFRRCKERSDEASKSSKKSEGGDIPQPYTRKAARLPLPEHVGRRAYSYAAGFKLRRNQKSSAGGVPRGDLKVQPSDLPSSPCFRDQCDDRRGCASISKPRAIAVGEAWSEPTSQHLIMQEGIENRRPGSPGRCSHNSRGRRHSSSAPRVPVSHAPAPASRVKPPSRRTSEVHEFLYREGRTREDRLRAKQEERDKELTFQPRLATTAYSSSTRRRPFGGAVNCPREGGEVESAGGDGLEAELVASLGAQERFEMLYQDSKAQLLRLEEDALKIPAACTFHPRLVSQWRPRSREKKKPQTASPSEGDGRKGAGEEVPKNTASDDDNHNQQDWDTSLLLHESLHEGHHGRHQRDTQDGGNDNEACRARASRVRGGSEGTSTVGRDHAGAPGLDEGGQEGATLAYPDRLHRGHDEQIKVWEKRQQERARLELEGCTFRPKVDASSKGPIRRHPGDKGDQTNGKNYSGEGRGDRPAHDRLYQAAKEARMRREAKATAKWRAETEECTFRPAVNRGVRSEKKRRGRTGSPESATRQLGVYERLNEAASDMRRRKIMRGKVIPPGCTFRPNVTPYKPTRRARAWTGAAAPPPPPASSRTHNASSMGKPMPPTPPSAGEDQDRKVHTIVVHKTFRRMETTAPATASGASVEHSSTAASARAAPTVEVDVPHQVEENGGGLDAKIPYMEEACFSPRRRRVKVEVRLHKLGDERQRRRNLSPRDPSKTQKERQEEEELKECTFKPVSYTKVYRVGTGRSKRDKSPW